MQSENAVYDTVNNPLCGDIKQLIVKGWQANPILSAAAFCL